MRDQLADGLLVISLGLTLSEPVSLGDGDGEGDGDVGPDDGVGRLVRDGDGLTLWLGFVPPPLDARGVGEVCEPAVGLVLAFADGVGDADRLCFGEELADGTPPIAPEFPPEPVGSSVTCAGGLVVGPVPLPPVTANAVPTPPAATRAVSPVTASTRRDPGCPSIPWMKSYRTERRAPVASRRAACQKLTCVPSKRTTRSRGGSEWALNVVANAEARREAWWSGSEGCSEHTGRRGNGRAGRRQAVPERLAPDSSEQTISGIRPACESRRPTWQSVLVTDTPTEPAAWLALPDVAERLDIPMNRLRQQVKEGIFLALRRDGVLKTPVELIASPTVLKHLPGVLTLLHDAGYNDEEVLRWLYTPDDSLPGVPAEALGDHRAVEVKRRAQATGF